MATKTTSAPGVPAKNAPTAPAEQSTLNAAQRSVLNDFAGRVHRTADCKSGTDKTCEHCGEPAKASYSVGPGWVHTYWACTPEHAAWLRSAQWKFTCIGCGRGLRPFDQLAAKVKDACICKECVASAHAAAGTYSDEAAKGAFMVRQKSYLDGYSKVRPEVSRAIEEGLVFDDDPTWEMSDNWGARPKMRLTPAGAMFVMNEGGQA